MALATPMRRAYQDSKRSCVVAAVHERGGPGTRLDDKIIPQPEAVRTYSILDRKTPGRVSELSSFYPATSWQLRTLFFIMSVTDR